MARRSKSTSWPILLLFVAVIAAVAVYRFLPALKSATPPGTTLPSAADANLLLGNPSGATADPANRNNYLMVKPHYALSYNDSTGTPNWVSWRVTAADLGDAPRKPQFDPDTTLPAGFKRIIHKDYTGSGFDRGHMCPHADRDISQESAWSTFVMTNIIPQAPNVNQMAWANLESYCRLLVKRGHRLYIIAGPVGQGGVGTAVPRQTIGGGRIIVPAECWKVVVAVPESGGADDLARINADTRVIAVIMPNDNTRVGDAWTPFRTSISAIERKTGLRFLDRVPPDVAAALKQKVDKAAISEGGG